MAEEKITWETPSSTGEEQIKWEKTQPEPGLERVGAEEYFIPGLKAYTGTLAAAKGLQKYGTPLLKGAAEKLVPKTGKELASQAAGASVLGAAGIKAGEKVEPKYRPAVETLFPLALGGVGAIGYRLGRGATAAIPKERIEAGRFMKQKGGTPSTEQIEKGKFSVATKAKLEQQQAIANREYNRALGLKEKESFGIDEFKTAKNKLSKEYDDVLKNQNIKFDKSFFDNLNALWQGEQKLGATGITFGQSKSVLAALEKMIGAERLPKDLKASIDKLSRLDESQISPKDSQMALDLVNRLLPTVSQQPEITMPATAYNEIRSILGDAASRTANDRNARLLRKIQEQFDNAADNSLPGEIGQRLKQVRLQWEALKTLEEAQLSSERGIISAEAVGNAIRKRIEQGSIYGTQNLLAPIGQAGESLGISAPATGRDIFQEAERGVVPRTTAYGALRDVLNLPISPLSWYRNYLINRRLSPMMTEEELLRRRTLPAGAAAAAGYGKEQK